eukprot:TRINITY_DN10421_c0_g2_i1.p1 TRINITY_DN10421_c0_g2~~TRINITY_DN10421_c0_g2_i1.p1  ORF type:complete len:279 (-),score=73.49 TRINITY_DN10421_c0_g2_i1:12-788(-)
MCIRDRSMGRPPINPMRDTSFDKENSNTLNTFNRPFFSLSVVERRADQKYTQPFAEHREERASLTPQVSPMKNIYKDSSSEKKVEEQLLEDFSMKLDRSLISFDNGGAATKGSTGTKKVFKHRRSMSNSSINQSVSSNNSSRIDDGVKRRDELQAKVKILSKKCEKYKQACADEREENRKLEYEIEYLSQKVQRIVNSLAKKERIDADYKTLQSSMAKSEMIIKQQRQLILCLQKEICLLYTSPSPRDRQKSRMPSSA